MKATEAKRLKELEQENARLKRLLADAELDKAMLKELAARCQLHRRARCLAAFVTRLIVTFALAPLSC